MGKIKRETRTESEHVSEKWMTQQEKGDGGEIPEQLSQLRGPRLDTETEEWMDGQQRDMCGCHPAISHAQREKEREKEGG